MKYWIIIISLLFASNLCAQTISTYWIYGHLQDGKLIASFNENTRCVDTTFAPYPMTMLDWEADTSSVIGAFAGNEETLTGELRVILPAGEYASCCTYNGGKWTAEFHSLYDDNGDGVIDLSDFGKLAERSVYEMWNASRMERETKCFIQLYGQSAIYEWRE